MSKQSKGGKQEKGGTKTEVTAAIEPNEMLRLVLDAIPVRVFWKNLESRYLGCNSSFARDSGLSTPEELIGLTDFDLGWADQAELYRADDAHVMSSGEARLGYEEPQTAPDGSTRWLRTSKIPLRDQHDEVIGMLGTYEDITPQKQSEADQLRLQNRLDRSQRLDTIGTLAAAVAHDFNNLLTVIGGNTELLLHKHDQDDGSKQALKAVLKAQEAAAGITRQLLTLSRKQVHQPRVVNMASIVLGLEAVLQRLTDSAVDLDIQVDPGAGCVRLDPTQAEQIVLNLILNAREAIRARGSIQIRIEAQELNEKFSGEYGIAPGRYVALVVSDTGIGIDDQTLEKIFDPFFSTKGDSGSGLGLAIAHEVTEQAGGKILVDSSVGKGTTFTAYLPQIDLPPDPELRPGEPLSNRSGCVLVVDDDPPIRRVVAQMIKWAGYQVLEAENGKDAIRRLKNNPVDLVVSDLAMPQMNGQELAAQIEKLDPLTPVLFISGYANDELLDTAGANILAKPFTQADLLSRVSALLSKRG